MNGDSERLAEDRARRNAARQAFESNLDQIKTDLAARSIGGRIADKAGAEVKGALSEAAAVARESKGIIAATLGALLVWFLRNPLLALLGRTFGNGDGDTAGEPDQVQED